MLGVAYFLPLSYLLLRQPEQVPEVLGTVMLFSMLNRVVDA